jgi:hypothetical protein
VRHPAEVTADQLAMLGSTLKHFGIDSVAGSGQYIQEEQPAAVLAAVARLARSASQTPDTAAH